ncbi:MAG: 1,4-dihydroxy-2-naphthoate octaprenyltransferase [Candidatus Neomarinimicrobiota bacterium]|nr:MAG: 1,4-dihydroxy-2-naphthoate octaprenyltransferase [Candidatus Neomarinimicrobiota bacterium]
MADFRSWIEAARLRTLPLATASILMGGAVAAHQGQFRADIFWLALGTALSLQILANLANDYGDFLKGADSPDRVGPHRGLQSGSIRPREMVLAIGINVLICALLGVPLIYRGFGAVWQGAALLFSLLGMAAIGAAIAYTVGKKPYGYVGLGDAFVFLFFGPVAVLGVVALMGGRVIPWPVLPAVVMGLYSVGVLNINNMRDRQTDARTGKRTLPVRLGERGAKVYHFGVITTASVCMSVYILHELHPGWKSGFLWALLLGLWLNQSLMLRKPAPSIDPYLRQLSLGTLALAVFTFFLIRG